MSSEDNFLSPSFLDSLTEIPIDRAKVKGGMRQFEADTIYITSPKHPDEWYTDDGSDKLNQLKRRITTIELKDTPLA